MTDSLLPIDLQALRPLVREHVSWTAWAQCIEDCGLTIDRPARSRHPEYPSIVYPLDYGFIDDTVGADGEPVDVFVGTGTHGLVGGLLTTDYRQGDRELTFLVDCTPPEIYMAHGFVNYDRTLMEGVLVLRRPLSSLWAHSPE